MKKKNEIPGATQEKSNGNGITELVFIIDQSGSMAGFENDTVGGFNAMIEKQKATEGKVYVSTVLFDNYSKVIHDRVDINEITPMMRDDYQAYGCTALFDAIGCAINHIGNVHKYARREDVPEHTVFVITTDGMENASRCYSREDVKNKIKRQTDKYGWEFIFVAANIDAVETAGRLGIRKERAVNYKQSREGYEACYASMSEFVTMKRRGAPMENDIAWKKMLEED